MDRHRELIGGRFLPYIPGDPLYDDDPYRDQRRRPWLVFRLGAETYQITDEHIAKYVRKLRSYFTDLGFLLDEDHKFLLYQIRINIDEESIQALRVDLKKCLRLRDREYVKGKLSVPTAIWFFDADEAPIELCDQISNLITEFSSDINFFKIDIDEVYEHMKAKNFTVLREWCREFVECVVSKENLPESLAKKSKPLIKTKTTGFGSKGPSMEKKPMEANLCEKSSIEEIELTLNELKIKAYPRNTIGRNNTTIIEKISGAFLFNRLAEPFKKSSENLKLLVLLNYSLSTIDTRCCETIELMLAEIFKKYFPVSIVKMFLEPVIEERLPMNVTVVDLTFELMRLFYYMFERCLLVNRISKKNWDRYFYVVQNLVCSGCFDIAEFEHVKFLQHVCLAIDDFVTGKTDNVKQEAEIEFDLDQELKRRKKIQEEEMQNDHWLKCELTEPPNDFRDIPSLPQPSELEDSLNPSLPYLRRIKLGEKYKDADHYLDVQYRLLREDFVRPLKDGIRAFKLGEERLTTYKISAISKKEISYFTGNHMYHAHIELTSDQQLAESDILTSSDLVAISSDQFTHDIHLAVVDDVRFEKSSEITLYMEDESRLDQSANYVLVKCLSFLPAYKHVLENLKNLSPFSPIPFERYLVYGKTDVMTPAYQAKQKKVEQIMEEVQMVEFYEKKRAEEMERRSNLRASGVKFRVFYDEEMEEDDYDLMTPIVKERIGCTKYGNMVKIGDKWYGLDDIEKTYHPTELDESQRLAFCHGLKSELALIQGPPGTGKTYIGVNLLKTILLNRSHWGINSPVLVCCFSNDGLDNFLESAFKMIESLDEFADLKDFPKLVRCGNNSNSKLLRENNTLRNDVKREFNYNGNRNASAYFNKKRDVVEKLQKLVTLMKVSSKDLLAFHILATSIGDLKEQFVKYAEKKKLNVEEVFAIWLLNKDYEGKMVEEEKNDGERFENDEDLDAILQQLNEKCALEEITKNMNDEDLSNNEFNFETTWSMFTTEANADGLVLMKESSGRNRDAHPLSEQLFDELQDIRQHIFDTKTTRLANFDEFAKTDIFELTREQRWQLYNNFVSILRQRCVPEIEKFIKEYKQATEELKKKLNREEAKFLKKSLVIGATTSGMSAMAELMTLIEPKVVIIDEAAEILEAHTLATFLPSVEHVICIGDHEQLRPSATVEELKNAFALDTSMFERLISYGFPHVTLDKQYRMNTDITKVIVRPYFYTNIIDGENVQTYPKVLGMLHRLQFYTHTQLEMRTVKKSYVNFHEAEMVAMLVSYLLRFYASDEISVITTYAAQKDHILSLLQSSEFENVNTVDSYQGKENTIVILSLVRSNNQNSIGFLQLKNRMCVALTRAKHGFYIFGNADLLADRSPLWSRILENMYEHERLKRHLSLQCEVHGRVMEVESVVDMSRKSPNGGCDTVCYQSLACGHHCLEMCHPLMSHEVMRCEQPCMRRCEKGHVCRKSCYEECSECSVFVEIRLDCGHSVATVCSNNQPKCDQRCTDFLPCGHQCQANCGEQCPPCEKTTMKVLPCGHTARAECSKPATCREKCTKVLKCGHVCTRLCDQECACETLVSKKLSPCGHTEEIQCSQTATTTHCQKPCGKVVEQCGHRCENRCGECFELGQHVCLRNCVKILECGHKCQNLCGYECGKCDLYCAVKCSHLQCGLGSNGYSRMCDDNCVLCVERCDNQCKHRACTLKCYEVCNVTRCEQECLKKLSGCGHACLGMCGEQCPAICATCNRADYWELFPSETSNTFSRLIQLPECGHIFTKQKLDAHASQFANSGHCFLKCPDKTCQTPIFSVKRYAKVIKAGILKKSTKATRQETVSITELVKMGHDILKSLHMDKSGPDFREVLKSMDELMKCNNTEIMAGMKSPEKLTVIFKKTLCLKSLACVITNTKCMCDDLKSKTTLNNTAKKIFSAVYNSQKHSSVVKNVLCEIIDKLKGMMPITISGVIQPMRNLIANATLLQHMIYLLYATSDSSLKMEPNVVDFFTNAARNILNGTANNIDLLEALEDIIINNVTSNESRERLQLWKSLNVPNI